MNLSNCLCIIEIISFVLIKAALKPVWERRQDVGLEWDNAHQDILPEFARAVKSLSYFTVFLHGYISRLSKMQENTNELFSTLALKIVAAKDSELRMTCVLYNYTSSSINMNYTKTHKTYQHW